MFIPKHFAMAARADQAALIRAHAFGLLITHGPAGSRASHIPFHYDNRAGPHGVLIGHIAKANPQSADLAAGGEVLAVFSGPHAYVSPLWYEAPERNVPTWNYTAVHAYGTAAVIDDPHAVHATLDGLARQYEASDGWRMDRADADYIGRLARAVTAFKITVTRLEGAAKLSQNKTPADRAGVIDGLQRNGETALADQMIARRPLNERETADG